MDRKSVLLMQRLPDDQVTLAAARLLEWLRREMGESLENPSLTESRARTLLLATQMVDEPTLSDFQRLISNSEAQRVALGQLLSAAGLGGAVEPAWLTTAGQPPAALSWLALAVSAFAWKQGYAVQHLDPAAPPMTYSPAGQVLHQAGQWLRRQTQRSATERERLARQWGFDSAHTPDLTELAAPQTSIPPLPPHFRPPIPVRYPEYNDPLTLSPEELPAAPPPPAQGEPISITNEELPTETPIRVEPAPEPEIKVGTPRPAPRPPTTHRGREAAAQIANTLTDLAGAVRRKFSNEPLKTTRLRVVVQSHPDGPGLPGLQVKLRCHGVSKYVAAATNGDGVFRCELPVREHSGLTYDVDVTWPREYGGKTERKSITLNTQRTEFTLPFYYRLNLDKP